MLSSTFEDKDASVAYLLPAEVTEERLLLLADFCVAVLAALNTEIYSRGCVVGLDVLGLEGSTMTITRSYLGGRFWN